jgi:hypothetical protein
VSRKEEPGCFERDLDIAERHQEMIPKILRKRLVTGGQASCDTMIPGDTIFFLGKNGP